MDERLTRIVDELRQMSAHWAMLTAPCSVFYATGHLVPIETGPSPFAGGPTTAFISRDGECVVVCSNLESVSASRSWAETHFYEGFAFDHGVDQEANYRNTIETAMRHHGIEGAMAVEYATLPSSTLAVAAPTVVLDFTPQLCRARATKTADEKAALTRSAQAAAEGQHAFYRAAKPGRSELEVFADIRCAIESFAGERVPLAGDFVSGRDRTAATGGWPTQRIIEAGDAVMSDLAPRVAGYWGDSCATATAGAPSKDFLTLFDASKSALEHAVTVMRPGLSISRLDSELRAIVAKAGFSYPHHSGHSIGTGVHQWPRIVPFETETLKEGMFLMVEPGAYHPDIGGVRTEWMIEVTETGCTPVAPFEHRARIEAI